jgi:hypothetical protein
MPSARDATGQASVELVALLPLLLVAVVALWQAVVVGQAAWSSAGAARAAARGKAIGADPLPRARAELPRALRRGLEVHDVQDGVRVEVPVPFVLTGARLTTIRVGAALPSQR